MNDMTDIKPALLTRSEIDWLLGKKNVSKAYEYYLRHSIKRKLQSLTELELPILKEKGLLDNSLDLSVYSKNLSANSKDKPKLLEIEPTERAGVAKHGQRREIVRRDAQMPWQRDLVP